MEKIQIRRSVLQMVRYDNEQYLDIDELIKFLSEIKTEKADSIYIVATEEGVEFHPMATRLETDSELKKRLSMESRRDTHAREFRRRQYEELKKEFDPKI